MFALYAAHVTDKRVKMNNRRNTMYMLCTFLFPQIFIISTNINNTHCNLFTVCINYHTLPFKGLVYAACRVTDLLSRKSPRNE